MPTSDRERSRSRSRSHSRSRKSSYSDDNYSQYSDESFYSDDASTKTGPKSKQPKSNASTAYSKPSWKKAAIAGKCKYGQLLKFVRRSNTKTLPNKKGPAGRLSKTSKTGGGGNGTPRGSMADYVTKRMLSARRIKINELKNEVDEMSQQMEELRVENRLIKRQKAIQDRALDKYEGQESDMPQVLQRHSEEVRTMREQLKRQKEKLMRAEKRAYETDQELIKVQRQLKKARHIMSEKNLGERDELSHKLRLAEQDREEKDKRLRALECHVEHLQKNHRHELGIERARHRETQRRTKELDQTVDCLQTQLKEKDKEIQVRNIYANRLVKPPHRLSSTRSSPAPTMLSSRDRKRSDPLAIAYRSSASTPNEKPQSEQNSRLEQAKRKEEENQLERERMERERDAQLRQEQQQFDQQRHELERQRQQQIEDEQRWENERRQQHEEQEELIRRDRERLEKEHRERDQKAWEEKERLEREKREREEREKREHEEQEREEAARRVREEAARKAREEEAAHHAASAAEQERQRQKELLLKRMKQIDEGTSSPGKNSPAAGTPTHQRRNYTFTKPIENLHNGKPANDPNVPIGGNRRGSLVESDDELSFGGYAPTFAGNTSKKDKASKRSTFNDDVDIKPKNAAAGKKNNLMAELFGSSSKLDKGADNIVPSPPNRRKSTAVNNDPFLPRENSASLLPRRGRQPSVTLNPKPTVNAIDILDDDIEEVTL